MFFSCVYLGGFWKFLARIMETKMKPPTLSLFYHFSTTEKVSFNLSHLSGVSPQNHQLKDYYKCLNSFWDLKDQ